MLRLIHIPLLTFVVRSPEFIVIPIFTALNSSANFELVIAKGAKDPTSAALITK